MPNRLAAFALLAAATLFAGCTSLTTTRHSFRLGETHLEVRVTQSRMPTPIMVNVHDDENTSVQAGRVVIQESGGRLIELVHSGKRFVEFRLEGQTYRFDPNRIYTENGIRATLTRQNNYSDAAHAVVRDFAQAFIETFELNRQAAIIALHNTGNAGLSINSYQPARELDRAADRVHETKSRSAGDFYYVTDERFFTWLKERDFNVMLQDNANVPDDGSMSVYFGRRGIPYLNIEANNNHLDEQIEMVRAAERMLAELEIWPKPVNPSN
jgi:hypothetical protein